MARRVRKVELQQDPQTGELVLDRSRIEEIVLDTVGAMLQFGGMANLLVRRVPVDEEMGEPVMECEEFLLIYETSAPAGSRPREEPEQAEPVAVNGAPSESEE